MTMSERKGLKFTAIAVGLVGISAGVLLGGVGVPSLEAQLQHDGNTTPITIMSSKVIRSFDGVPNHDERITTNKTVMKVVHSLAGIPLHEHVITAVTITTETTPDGKFYDFKPMQLPSVNKATAEVVASKDLVFSELTVDPTECAPREPIHVKVNVTNTGTERGPFTIPLKLDGVNLTTQSINLAPGASQNVIFTINIQTTGGHVITIGDQRGDVLVGGAVGG